LNEGSTSGYFRVVLDKRGFVVLSCNSRV